MYTEWFSKHAQPYVLFPLRITTTLFEWFFELLTIIIPTHHNIVFLINIILIADAV